VKLVQLLIAHPVALGAVAVLALVWWVRSSYRLAVATKTNRSTTR